MAKISVQDSVSSPRDVVFATFRDKLDELDEFLPDIESIVTESREDLDDGRTRIVRVWRARPEEIPSAARKFIKPEMLQWTDTATWNPNDFSCEWEMEVGFLTDAITAKGVNRYSEDGDSTGIVIDGVLGVDASKIPGVPRLIAGKVGSAVEKFVVKMITPNLKDVNRGIEKYFAAQD
ncbi:DUF2505 family protein [Bradymonas sediminis]|uniref:Uncharacterized protein n=1 Tax=Bradymonas sediminis TaxID=1548548 RepID=A0A2Z4FNQ3_9DELT|nr:DUF2505 family protein [Bradymonas sediminis]AWV90500.1 hypothetical protein DN745_14665 [Bradymonas sediminis]TDP72107.1 hypothetical protein DFR33_10787 [Bradymonas sediminis]